MKYVAYTIAVILLLTSYSAAITKSGGKEMALAGDSIVGDYSAHATAIYEKKQEMLSAADSVIGHFCFTCDPESGAQDSPASWLMNRMLLMVELIQTADDAWAWVLAMNESREECNDCLGHKIGSVDAAVLAIEEQIDIYRAGNQPEMNVGSYISSILAYYKAVCEYNRLISGIDDHDDENDEDIRLRNLCYREFCEWFDLHNAVNAIMYGYTYAAAGYSALPMETNGLFERWSRARAKELDIERKIYQSSGQSLYIFKRDSRGVSPEKFDKLIAYFKGRTHQDVIEEIVSDMVGMDYDYAKRRTDGCYDFDKIAAAACRYETALRNWRTVREQIARSFKDKGQQRSYRKLTEQIHTRFYNDLEELKKIQY